MNRIVFISISILSFAFLSVLSNAQDKTPFSNLDVFELEWASDPQISPDGTQIIYRRNGMNIMKDNRHGQLWMINPDGTGHMKLTHNEVSESNPRWSPDGTRIAFVSSTDNGAEIFVYWVETGKFSRLTQLEKSPRGITWSPDGTQIAFSMLVPQKAPQLVRPPQKPKGAKWAEPPRVTLRLNHESDGSGYIEHGFSHLFVIPAEGGTPRQITSGNFHHRGLPAWTKDGSSLIFSANRNADWEIDYRNSEIYVVSIKNGITTALTSRKGRDSNPAVSPDGQKVAYLSIEDRIQTYQISRLYVMNIDGGGKREIETGLDRSISQFSWDNQSSGLYIQYDDKGNTKIGHVPLKGKSQLIANNLGGTSIGRPYGGGSFSISEKSTFVYTYTTPYHPAELAVLENRESEPKLVTALNKDILAYKKLGKVEEVWYKSTVDNRDIQGWLVYPPEYRTDGSYPLLVENHGGPISNYGDRFSPEMQLYAAGGYIVFYPNPRGSTSYGEEFGNLLYHNYPGDDYQDVMDGVDYLVARGIVSEDSLFVTGGSAGGIMTAWIIGKNNRFRAAAVVKPVMNWISKTLTADNYYMYANYRFPGQPWENPETYMKFSPISLVANVETPTIVIVGSEDLRTPLSESKQLYHALKLRQIPTALVEIPGAYHFISRRPSQLITKVDHVLAWFEKYRGQE